MSLACQDVFASPLSTPFPSLRDVQRTAVRLAGQVVETPVWRWQTGIVAEALRA
jgi:threonine dehydratase